MSATFISFLAWHQLHARAKPLQTNMIQSTVLMSTGDTIAQYLEKRARPEQGHNYLRTAILSSWAAGINAPFWTLFYSFLFTRYPGRIVTWVAASAALSPFWNAAFFSYSTALTVLSEEGTAAFRGDGPGRLAQRVRQKLEMCLVPTVKGSMTLWVSKRLNRGQCKLCECDT